MQNKGTVATPTQSELKTLIAERLNSGKQKMQVVDELVRSGMTHGESMQIVEQIAYELKKTVREEEFSGEVMLPALLGGLIAAVVSGAIWGGITILTGYEVGYVAIGVGYLCGLGVVMMSKGKRGMPLQMIAIMSSVLGILIGKYIAFFDIFKGVMATEAGAEAVSWMAMFSTGMIQFFASNIASMASGFDLLWIALAVYTAWSIPKASGLKI
jgi:hypothetical protein